MPQPRGPADGAGWLAAPHAPAFWAAIGPRPGGVERGGSGGVKRPLPHKLCKKSSNPRRLHPPWPQQFADVLAPGVVQVRVPLVNGSPWHP